MADAQPSTTIANISEFDKYMRYIKYKYTWNSDPIGFIIENGSGDPKVTIIDKNENIFNAEQDFFYNHELFQWPKILLSEAGVETQGKDYIGSNLTLSGTLDVMTRIPNGQYYYRYEEDANTQIYKYAPYNSNHRGFDYFPHCYAGGGTKHDHFYVGTYKAGLNDYNGTLKLTSWSGAQPWTGGQIRSIPFTFGNTVFTVGETLTGTASGATGTVVSWHTTSGDWAAGTAVGTVYIKNYGVYASTATAFSNGETLARTSGSATTSGVSTVLSLTLDQALTYASNKGAGWTISDIYSTSWIQGLLYTMAGTRNLQTKYGKGVVNLPTGNGYAGLLNGANNVNTNINSHGIGEGDGLDGSTPIMVNNICDPWGGCWEFVSGINVNTDGTILLTKPDGTGIISSTLPAGSYTTLSEKAAVADGYIKYILTEELGAITFSPSSIGSTAETYFCDYWYYPRYSPSTLFSGGAWSYALYAGAGFRSTFGTTSYSSKNIGVRLKYIPQT